MKPKDQEGTMKLSVWDYGALMIILVVALSRCAAPPIKTTTMGPIDSENRLLIATQKSEFKDAVVSKVAENFEKESVFIEVTDLSNLSQKPCEAYRAIVIVNAYRFFQINQDVKEYIEASCEADKKKIVLLTTAGSPHHINHQLDVDAISSASRMTSVDAVSNTIITKVQSLLTKTDI
jgi:hypothetical protein